MSLSSLLILVLYLKISLIYYLFDELYIYIEYNVFVFLWQSWCWIYSFGVTWVFDEPDSVKID